MTKLVRTARISFDIFLFGLVCFSIFAIHKWFEPFKRGFFCNDESLQYPYRENTVGITALVSTVLAVPGLVMLAVELFRHIEAPIEKLKGSSSSTKKTGCHIGYRFQQCYKQIGFYLFGLGLTLVATELSKYSIGRLRPHFLAVCQPQMPDGSSCEDEINQGRYIEEYTCLGVNSSKDMLTQLPQSFPSGHTSMFCYAMLYTAIYLQAALSTRASKLLKHLLQFVFVMLAWYVALTRISDYMHHWTDVLAGVLLGCLFALLISIFVADLFNSYGRKQQRFIAITKTQQVKPSAAAPTTTNSTASTAAAAHQPASSAASALPAYTFGNMPYLHYPHQYAQTYHNYGYVP